MFLAVMNETKTFTHQTIVYIWSGVWLIVNNFTCYHTLLLQIILLPIPRQTMKLEHIGYLPRMKLILRIQFLEYILRKMLPPIICIIYFDTKWVVMNCDPIPCN